MSTPLTVAVIGAGAAGLAAARELLRANLHVTIFEHTNSIGGTWVYSNPYITTHPLSKTSHSSIYRSLRTNLPREVMGFTDYPFVGSKHGGDNRRFPGHAEVRRYLEGFAREFGLEGLVRYGREVVRVAEEDGRWVVRSRGEGESVERKGFDAVVVCNGHYTEPRIAEIQGIDAWPGKQIHSHNYRVPEPFKDQVVVIIGSSASAVDISRDIAKVAKEVRIASRSAPNETPTQLSGYENMWLHSMVERANEDGTILFQDGSLANVDVIVHCTGYKYHFPFLETNDIVTVDDNCVGPLYKHIFPPSLAPYLSFIGIPWKIVPFPLVELQSKWVAAILSGRIALPTPEKMMEDVKALYSEIEAMGWPKRYTHNISYYQFEYDDWLARECSYPIIEEWRKQMYEATSNNRKNRPESYRDEWDDDDLVALAHKDFEKYLYRHPKLLNT